MLIVENIRLAVGALGTNKMRVFLTMLGIIIGIGSVISIMTVSKSLATSISHSFQEMGAGNVTIGIKQVSDETEARADGMRFGTTDRGAAVEEKDRITDEMIGKMKAEFADQIDAVAVSESVGNGTVTSGNDTANITVSGINEDYFKSSQVTLLAGRTIKKEDLEGSKKVIMVSDKVVENMFDGNNDRALWQKISVDTDGIFYDYYIVGIYKYEENGSFSSSSDEEVVTAAYIPLTTAKEQIHAEDGYEQITVVTAADISSVSVFAQEIEQFFAPYYSKNEDYKISAATMESMTQSLTDMIRTVTVAVSFIAGISLLVGGIGVMNIMLVSITERTKEIGIRKALGAKNSHIRFQFIVEAVILCLAGGCIGILFGVALGCVAASLLGYPASAPVAAIVVSVGFSIVIGIFFGYYPAGKAAKLDPVEALRYE